MEEPVRMMPGMACIAMDRCGCQHYRALHRTVARRTVSGVDFSPAATRLSVSSIGNFPESAPPLLHAPCKAATTSNVAANSQTLTYFDLIESSAS